MDKGNKNLSMSINLLFLPNYDGIYCVIKGMVNKSKNCHLLTLMLFIHLPQETPEEQHITVG